MSSIQLWFWLAMTSWVLLLSTQVRGLALAIGVAAWLTIALGAVISGPELCSPIQEGYKRRLILPQSPVYVTQISGILLGAY